MTQATTQTTALFKRAVFPGEFRYVSESGGSILRPDIPRGVPVGTLALAATARLNSPYHDVSAAVASALERNHLSYHHCPPTVPMV